MKHQLCLLCACVLVVVACSDSASDGPQNAGAAAGGMSGGFGGTAGTSPVGGGGAGGMVQNPPTGGAAGAMQQPPVGGVGGTGAGTGGVAGGGTGGIGGTGGMMDDAGTAGGGAGGMGSSAVEPIIPEINGECPTFQEGTNTVSLMGITATVIAGAKSDGTAPLLFYYYGTGKLGGVSTLPRSIKDDIVSLGGIVFAPNSALNTGGDCSGTGTFGIDDFKISDQVVACAVKNYGIDPRRIYATGCSAGGLTTGCMGIMRSNYVAAVAPNSGGVTIGYGDLQNPNHMPNAITMNGGAGDNVIVNFGNTSEAYDNYVLKYGGFAVNCIHNSGHCGAPTAVYESAWKFLMDHPFGVTPEPYESGLPSGFASSCKIFEMTDMAPLGGF